MVGTKWYKCDLHVHTPASKCFYDTAVTPEQWVKAAKEKGLDCVGVTDHNSAEWIESIQEEAKTQGLHIFPGVELTCSEAKVHLLILFEIGTTKTVIEDFMLVCGIKRTDFGQIEAHSSLNVKDILSEVNKLNAICIPAHIDDFSGIFEVAHTLREELFKTDAFLGVQSVYKDLAVIDKDFNKATALISINKTVGVSDTDIEEGKLKITAERIKELRSPIQQAFKYGKAILTFSDNPHSTEMPNKHGISGIGNSYTWIKMDQQPSLESLRQALLLYQFRIKNNFECPEQPYTTPETWIKSITIKNTHLSKSGKDVEIKFNPQMNTIIGGRGSGKSSILQFLRGVFSKENEKDFISLENIKKEFSNFFKIQKNNQGVLKPGCCIEVIVNRRDELFKVVYNQENITTPKREIIKFNEATGLFTDKLDLSYLINFDFDIYSQKQIYEIANNSSSLREKIDLKSPEITTQLDLLSTKKAEFIQQSTAIRTLQQKIASKEALKATISDLESKILKVNETGIESELKKLQEYNSDEKQFVNFRTGVTSKNNQFEALSASIEAMKFGADLFSDLTKTDLSNLFDKLNGEIEKISNSINKSKEDFANLETILNSNLEEHKWTADKKETELAFASKKQTLIEQGIANIDEIEADIKKLELKKIELKAIEAIEVEIKKQLLVLTSTKESFVTERLKLSTIRETFLTNLLTAGKVRAKVKNCKDLDNLELLIRTNLNCQESFDSDIAILLQYWSGADPKRMNKGVFDKIVDIHQGLKAGTEFNGKFITKIKALVGEQLDNLNLMFPEDDIQLEYLTNAGVWKPLSNASAGQKTAAILTLILSDGNKPLILDQPEDDLDNYLIYDLVVEQLRKSKESRQIITVTHNANIPVNGDSEVIIVMDSETKYLSPKQIGTIEDAEIKKSVCSIMEGGTDAFNMRSKRYQNVKTNG